MKNGTVVSEQSKHRKALYNAGLFLFVFERDRMNERDSAVVGIRGTVYNWLVYGTVGNSVCRMWKS